MTIFRFQVTINVIPIPQTSALKYHREAAVFQTGQFQMECWKNGILGNEGAAAIDF
ncbi:MAG: hypothetical protein ACR2PH_16180 [Desulfobulbia bacterium]